MNQMEMNDRLRSESLSTTGRYNRNADSFVDHQECQVTSTCRNDNEMIRMQLRRLWKTLLNKNEKCRFEVRKFCRTKTVKFLGEHVFSPCERVRYLALDLLCGTVPRLEDKTDSLLQPLAPKVIQCFSENSCREVGTKALHFLRTYARHTKSVHSFMDLFFHSGIESNSDAVKVNCLYGVNVIFDQDIGDKLYSRLVLTISSFLKGNSHPLVFLACYRVLKRIHEQTEDERFYKLLDLADEESKVIYINFLNFEANDPYLSAEMEDLGNLISEYQRKRNSMRLSQAFGIVEPIFLNRIGATRGCERAVMVEKFEVAIKRVSWTEYDLESHVQDLIKLIASFLIDSNKLIQISGLEILKEIVQRMGFHLSPYLGNITDILLVPLVSSNIKIKSKTEKLLHKLMKNIHPMTVIWELLNERDAIYREAVLVFLFDVLKGFSYYELDLACLFVTIGQWMEDQNPEIRSASRDCIKLLLEIMETSPVSDDVKTQSIGILLRNCRCQADTLRSVGINVGDSEESHEDFDSLTEMSAESTEESNMETLNNFPSETRNSKPNQLQSQMLWNHPGYENNETTHSFTTTCNDSFISYDGDKFSDVYLSKLTLKSTKTDKQSHATPSLPPNSRGQLQSAASRCTGEQTGNSESFLAHTNYNNPYIGPPQHNSTPRRQWNAAPQGRFDDVPTASETTDLSAVNTFESGNDTLPCQKGSHKNSLKKETSMKSQIQQNAKHYAYQYADGQEWNGNYSNDPHIEYYEDTCKGDAGTVTTKSDRKRSKTYEEMQSAGDRKSTPSNGFHLESMDPEKYNFNIIQVSTPQTMESIKEINEETNEIIKIKITEVTSSCLSTPNYSEVDARTNEAVKPPNAANKKKRRQRSKFTAIRSPVPSTCSSLNDTKTEFVAKIPKRPTNKKDLGKISVGKVSLHSVQAVKSNTRKDDRSFVANNKKVSKTKGLARPSKKKNVSKSSIDESHVLEPEVITTAGENEDLDTTLQANCEESDGKAHSIMTESDINQEFLEVIDFVFESEYEKEGSTEEVDDTMIVEEELIPETEFSEIVEDIMTVDEQTIVESEFSEIVDDIMAVNEEIFPEAANDKLDESALDESNTDFSETEIVKDCHLSTVEEENSEKSSPAKNDKELTRIVGKGQNKINTNTKNKVKGSSVEKMVKPKTKPVLKKMTKSTESGNRISNKNAQSGTVTKKTTKVQDRIFLNANIQSDQNDLENTDANTVDEEITDTKNPVKTKKNTAKPTAKVFTEIPSDADDSIVYTTPFKKGKELPRTPVTIQENTKSVAKTRVKDVKKKTVESRRNSLLEKKKLSDKKKTTEVKKVRSATWKKTSPCIPKAEDADEIQERTTVESTADGEFVGCQWRRDLEYAVKGGTCTWAEKFEHMIDKMQPFQSSEVADIEMKKSLEDLNGKSWKAKEEAMSVMIRLAKHHPQSVYDQIPKIIVSLCNEVKNFRQSVAGKAVLTIGYMYEYLGKKLESKLRLAVGALLAKSGNRTLAAYFRLIIKSLFKIVNSNSPQKVALAFIQEGGRHPNKASRETTAQFLALLTVTLGPSKSLTSPTLAGPMIKCAAQFASDCSALTRHCGKRMFQVLMSNPNFGRLKEHYLDINTTQDLAKVLEQIETKGVSEEILPIKIIK